MIHLDKKMQPYKTIARSWVDRRSLRQNTYIRSTKHDIMIISSTRPYVFTSEYTNIWHNTHTYKPILLLQLMVASVYFPNESLPTTPTVSISVTSALHKALLRLQLQRS